MNAISRALVTAAIVNVAASPGAAQDAVGVVPSLSTTQMYDSNLFSTPTDARSDYVTRVTPALFSRLRRPLWSIEARSTVDLERYARHPELASPFARASATMGLRARPSARTTITADADLLTTQSPGELSGPTGLIFARARAQRTTAHGSAVRSLSATRSASVEYQFTADRIRGGFTAQSHALSISSEHRRTEAGTMTVAYRLQEFTSSTPGASSVFSSHVIDLGWQRRLSPRLSVEVSAGPRLTGVTLNPELAAAARYRLASGELGFAYARTQTSVVGLRGPVDTQGLSATAQWSPSRSTHVRLSPGVLRTSASSVHADIFHVSAGFSRELVPLLTLHVDVDSSTQRGNPLSSAVDETIGRRSLLVTLAASPGPLR